MCFLLPVCWLLYAAVCRRALVKYTPFLFVGALCAVAAAALLQAGFRSVFSERIIFSVGAEGLFLYSFVQTGLIEELSKVVFLFFTLNKMTVAKSGYVGRSETAVFYFAVLFGLLFAAFETLAGTFYLLGTTVPRMFTAYLLHPVSLLLSASGVFFTKRLRGGMALAFIAAFLLHGFYNLVVVFFGRPGAAVYMALSSVVVLSLWWKIAGRGIVTGEGDIFDSME